MARRIASASRAGTFVLAIGRLWRRPPGWGQSVGLSDSCIGNADRCRPASVRLRLGRLVRGEQKGVDRL